MSFIGPLKEFKMFNKNLEILKGSIYDKMISKI